MSGASNIVAGNSELQYPYCCKCGHDTNIMNQTSACCCAEVRVLSPEVVPVDTVERCRLSLTRTTLLPTNSKLAVLCYGTSTTQSSPFMRVDDEVSNWLLDKTHNAATNYNIPSPYHMYDFVSQPQTLSASTLSCRKDLRDALKASCSVAGTLDVESKIIDRILGKINPPNTILQHSGILEFIHSSEQKDLYVPVFVKPDAIIEVPEFAATFVIEFKTYKNRQEDSGCVDFKTIDKWAHQIASYQFVSVNDGAPPKRYLLAVLMMSDAGDRLESQLLVLELRPGYLTECHKDWTEWLSEFMPKHLKYIKKYHMREISFSYLDKKVKKLKNSENATRAATKYQSAQDNYSRQQSASASVSTHNSFGCLG